MVNTAILSYKHVSSFIRKCILTNIRRYQIFEKIHFAKEYLFDEKWKQFYIWRVAIT